ncbi:AraC family transcriptional regulator [Amycolatopsis sp. WAC 01376]|uniref:AraC family transcriptional regulator n=1 Tax=Amycolatopsis sp. WAC 01376 TaxID=2203195 RepID=UPI0013152FB8|nr:AraC family transcriptional regulator [Amycolatopsis sp. WAC 01376]
MHRPLGNYTLLVSEDPGEMGNELAGLLGECRFRPLSAPEGSTGRVHARQTKNFTVAYLEYPVAAGLWVECPRRRFLISIPVTGSAAVIGGKRGLHIRERRGHVVNPGAAMEARWTRKFAQLMVVIDRGVLETRLSSMLGRALPQPLRFEEVLNLARQPAKGWYDALGAYLGSLDDTDSALEIDAVADSVEQGLMTTFLASQRHNYWDVVTGDAKLVSSRTIREAIRLIDAQPHRNHSVPSLARELGVSVRALEKGFKRHLATTPNAYLRDVRLRRAHADLSAGEPDVVTVAQVAQRHGFFHFGRFAATYRDRFGEAPSHTLRRLIGPFR